MDSHESQPHALATNGHLRDDLSDREALELREPTEQHFSRSVSKVTVPDDEIGLLKYSIRRFWTQHISQGVPHHKCRDHLALERTFLAYLRTGQAFAMLGVVVAQTMRLGRAPLSPSDLHYFAIGVPLSSVCHVMATIVTVTGFLRFLRLQKSLILGIAITGGWEISCISGLEISVCCPSFRSGFLLTTA